MSIGKYHVGAMSIWQYSGHIVRGATTDGSRSELSWQICHGLPEAREAVGHLESLAQSGHLESLVTISVCRGFLQHVKDFAGGAIALATCYRLAMVWELLDDFTKSEFSMLCKTARAPLI